MANRTLSSADRVVGLRCEGLDQPRLLECPNPRFSWKIDSERRGAAQVAYQLRIRLLCEEGEWLADSGRIDSERSQWVRLEGVTLEPKRAYLWQVRIWNEAGELTEWSELARLDTGLMGLAWPAAWISDGKEVAVGEAPPARYFSKAFELPQKAIRATIYLSAFGVVQPWLNGDRIDDDYLSPGWPDYRKRVFYQSYELTEKLRVGRNVVGLVLGDGWYSGTLFLDHQYGPTPKVSAFIEIELEDGSIQTVVTGREWSWQEGPIRENGIYRGEAYDARLEDASWTDPAAAPGDTIPVTLEADSEVPFMARLSPPVRRIEELRPVEVRSAPDGSVIYDLGQNMVGWVRLKARAEAGQEIGLRFAEMLESDGSLHTANLRSAKATASYVAKGGGELETWEPTFTFFGFRYVELSGVEDPLPDAITGIVVHTDLQRTGTFECSNPLLNQLFSNTLWGQKGNFLELPTDCPQRDERLGWTGDAQVFCHTALYNMDAGVFYRQWLAAVRDSFKEGPEGGFGSVAPVTGFAHGSAGWADAGAIVPWVAWLHTGDRSLLVENFDAVCDWIELMRESAPEGIRISKEGWGDWLAPWHAPKEAPTPYPLIATAYYAYSTQIAVWMAEELGHDQVAAEYGQLLAEVKAAFQREYVDTDGKIRSDEQTAYLLALAFDLVAEEQREKMVEHLVKAFEAKDNHLATGFIGTPLLAPVLSQVGKTDLAYEVVQKETYPGWLYSVKNGATTIWERWDSWTPEQGFNPGGMNSFNHYAYGAVVGWLYDTVAGLKPDPAFPGWKRFRIEPEIGGGLRYASASLETPYGLAVSVWKRSEDGVRGEIRIPPNARAQVSLPAVSVEGVRIEGTPLDRFEGPENVRCESGRVSFDLAAGSYRYEILV
ncbi:family 78 glycoside hydrolase catalytic domain [Pelagicoccus sp. SDUM812005]|uniref:family 78 glycoside hydrolase catalytic domain n=1 Tax=Pelagicoccus sp. SDUM812005 TaxID=3041257 RepID=UPI00280F284A|nr:family 78 glycoside hydrolase catalytic domain [Pelagicoccus sp. SDUM812005]MDQ8183170.1 family 78 glycoside hydrolase catalytic domain [Pelagicoccus sp. SDUM812005]